MQKKLIHHYQSLYEKYGENPKAVQWSSTESQKARFQLLNAITDELSSVIDYGCGLGAFYEFIKAKEPNISYLGIDCVPEFVKFVKVKTRFDTKSDASLSKKNNQIPLGYDYCIISGVFNNKLPNNWSSMKEILRNATNSVNKGVAFNGLSTYVDYQEKDLYYVNPEKVLRYCKEELKAFPVLRADYILTPNGFPYEFTIYIYKKPSLVNE